MLAEGKISSLAQQLFSKNAFTLVGGISSVEQYVKPSLSMKELVHKMNAIPEVAHVEFEENRFVVESNKDVSAELSRLVVQSGYGLNFLSKKEYGLDDIYYQYFQEGKAHEK
jgi:ABC-2 type transport system ATP-binding protein